MGSICYEYESHNELSFMREIGYAYDIGQFGRLVGFHLMLVGLFFPESVQMTKKGK